MSRPPYDRSPVGADLDLVRQLFDLMSPCQRHIVFNEFSHRCPKGLLAEEDLLIVRGHKSCDEVDGIWKNEYVSMFGVVPYALYLTHRLHLRASDVGTANGHRSAHQLSEESSGTDYRNSMRRSHAGWISWWSHSISTESDIIEFPVANGPKPQE